jgi:hypothetical protein
MSILGKKMFPGKKFYLATLLQDASGNGNVITDADAIDYLRALQAGDHLSWVKQTDAVVIDRATGEELRLQYAAVTSEEALVDAVEAFVAQRDEVSAPKPNQRAKASK